MGAYTCEFGVVHKVCRCPTPHTVKCDVPQEHNPGGSEVTQAGRWVHKDANIHRCQKPPYDKSVKTHDRWQCNTCDKVWIVARVGFDQRDNSSWLEWAEYESWKSGPFAPGTK